MALLFSFVIFLLFAAGLSFAGMKLYVKPKEAMERVAGTGLSAHDAAPVHPSLAVPRAGQAAGQPGSGVAQGRDGDAAPADPRRHTAIPNALKVLYGAKAILAVLLPLLTTAGGH